MKKTILICLLALVLVAVALMGRHYLDSLLEPANIAAESGKLLGTPVKLTQKPEWSLFPPRIVFHNLEWQFDSETFSGTLKIPQGSLAFELPALLQGRYALSDASLEEPVASLRLKTPLPIERKANPASRQKPDDTSAFSLKKLNIRKGALEIHTDADSLNFSAINLSSENLALHADGNIQSDFSFAWQKPDTSATVMAGKTSISGNFNFSPTLLAFSGFSLSFAPDGKPQTPIAITFAGDFEPSSMRFRISEATGKYANWNFNLSGQGDPGDFSGNARINLENGSTPGNNPVSASASMKFSDGSLLLRNLEMELLGNRGHGQIETHFQNNGAPPRIEGQLDFPRLNLDGLGRSSTNTPTASEEARKTSLSLPDMDLRVKLSKLVWRKLEFADVDMPIQIRAKVASVPAAHFAWAGGVADATFSANLNTSASDLRLHADRLNMGAALAELGLNGISGGKASISGHLSATGSNWSEISSSLSGRIQIVGNDAKIGILQKIASSLPVFLNAQNLVPDTVDSVSATCAANMGILYCRDLSAAANRLQCSGAATLDLHDCQINGSVKFKAGKLDLPITFKGPLDDISWRPGSGFLEQLRELLP